MVEAIAISFKNGTEFLRNLAPEHPKGSSKYGWAAVLAMTGLFVGGVVIHSRTDRDIVVVGEASTTIVPQSSGLKTVIARDEITYGVSCSSNSHCVGTKQEALPSF